MKKRVTVKRMHRHTKARDILYRGLSDFNKENDCIKLSYQEENKEASVTVEVLAYPDYMELRRQGETSSSLVFKKGAKTKGILSSPYGDIDIDLITYQYICKENIITLEYDIMNDTEVTGGYRIIWNIKEE